MNENIEHDRHKRKFIDFIYKSVVDVKEIKILEFGVRHGISTEFFLKFCEKKNGFLYSVDMDDSSKKFNSNNWIQL